MIGIIYLRTSPNGKNYIGQTINEYKRQNSWFGSAIYSGPNALIDRARNKYTCSKFSYRVLAKIDMEDEITLCSLLNDLEVEYIDIFKSHVSTGIGYNLTRGGNYRLEALSVEHKSKISKANKGKIPKNLESIQQSEKTKQANRDRGNAVIVYTKDGLIIGEYHSTNAACLDLGLDRGSASRVLNSKAKSLKGYIIKLKENG